MEIFLIFSTGLLNVQAMSIGFRFGVGKTIQCGVFSLNLEVLFDQLEQFNLFAA